MAQILGLIFRDKELSQLLAFKGGTALMFFHGLPRFSTDLDFNLLDPSREEVVFAKIRSILQRFGTIDDEAIKHYGILLVLNYGHGERMLKVEISNRQYSNHYEVRNLAGTDIRVMTTTDMFAHKLCAMGERTSPRDIFDCWFFLSKHCEINEQIVFERTGMSVSEYSNRCAAMLREMTPKILMQGLGEVLDTKGKTFVRTRLLQETASALELFAAFPLIVHNIEK